MSEEQAYYVPDARFIQGKQGVWILKLREPAPGETMARLDAPYNGAFISKGHVTGEEEISLSQWPADTDFGREMVLEPVETLAEVEAKMDALMAWIEHSSTALPSVRPERIYTHTIAELLRIKFALFGPGPETEPNDDF